MSEENDPDTPSCCASCGIAEIDEIKLKECGDCDLVRYCSDECQQEHKSKHEEACQKRAAELRDEILFMQPECSHLGDCPICCLPLPLVGKSKYPVYSCCCKMICKGCVYANQKRETEGKLQQVCPFCRHPLPKSKEEEVRNIRKRVEANDPVAICYTGVMHRNEGDYNKALEYLIRSAELGCISAHFYLHDTVKNEEERIYHLEEAAIGGHADARHNLGCVEASNGSHGRALKHFIIAANLGHDGSLANLKEAYKCGLVRKEVLASALRAHHASVVATKSPQRVQAEKNHVKQLS